MSKTFYITTTLPYVNSDPHVGFAMEIIRADVIARIKKLQGFEVFFNTGTDEHGQKLLNDATSAGEDIQKYVDKYAEKFRGLKTALNISDDVHFIRTTDEHHIKSAQEFWKICNNNGYIYKKKYNTKYCVGCELEKTDSELVGGKCPIHPTKEIEVREEENYFFKFSEFQDKLLKLYEENPTLVIPDFRFNEIKSFVKKGLQDFSISRLKSKMSWGVEVPGDGEHIMYVWFDALVNYISNIGWPEDEENFNKFWVNGTPVQYCGKDNLRQQSAMWQAMLMAVDIPPTKHIVINGFVSGEGGVKMSKSLGNVINPYDVVNEYGTDALRYFVLREISSFEDSPFTMDRFKESYNANLANGIGNLVSRVMRMATTYLKEPVEITKETTSDISVVAYIENFEFNRAMDAIWERIGHNDALITIKKPFSGIKSEEPSIRDEALSIVKKLVRELYFIATDLEPFMPETSIKIKEVVKTNKMPTEPLFLRKQ